MIWLTFSLLAEYITIVGVNSVEGGRGNIGWVLVYYSYSFIVIHNLSVLPIAIVSFSKTLFVSFVFSCPVRIEVGLCCKSLVTLITWIREHIWEMVGFHMIPCTGAVLVGELVTKSAVVSSIFRVPVHKLEQLLGVLELVSCGELLSLDLNSSRINKLLDEK